MSVHTAALEAIEAAIQSKESDYKTYRLNTDDYEKRYLDSLNKREQMENEIQSLKETMIFLVQSAV